MTQLVSRPDRLLIIAFKSALASRWAIHFARIAGNLEEKVAEMKEGLTQLTGLGIGRGSMDNYSKWAMPGTDELHQVLMESGVPHQFDEHVSGGGELRHRLVPVIMPFFAEHLETESSS